MRRRVVVTGMGMVTPVGRDLESSWRALQEGQSGVDRITLFDASTFPTQIAAEAKHFRLADYLPDGDRWDEHSRNTQFALAAAKLAMDHSGLDDFASLDRTLGHIKVVLGELAAYADEYLAGHVAVGALCAGVTGKRDCQEQCQDGVQKTS